MGPNLGLPTSTGTPTTTRPHSATTKASSSTISPKLSLRKSNQIVNSTVDTVPVNAKLDAREVFLEEIAKRTRLHRPEGDGSETQTAFSQQRARLLEILVSILQGTSSCSAEAPSKLTEAQHGGPKVSTDGY